MPKGKLGYLSIVLLGVNAIIGSGIFLLPYEAMRLMGPASIVVFAFDIVLVATISLCFAEVSSLFSRTGGAYIYAKEAFGDFVGFEIGFIKWVTTIIAWATLTVALVTTLSVVMPCLNNAFYFKALAVGIIIALVVVNLLGVHISKLFNNVVTLAKLLPLVIFAGVGLFFINKDNFTPFVSLGMDSFRHSFTAAALAVFYAFTGFESMVVAAGDMHRPKEHLPKAIMCVLGILATIYIGIQCACVGILGGDLASSKAPIADAASVIFGPWGRKFVYVGMLVSIGGTCVAASFISPRVGAALAQDGMLPGFMARESVRKVPAWSILITGFFACFVAASGSFLKLAMISAIASFAQYIPTCLSVLVLRNKYRGDHTFRVPWGPLIPMIAIFSSFWLLSQTDFYVLAWGLGGLLVAVPVYWVMRLTK